jgi:predicted 3-demethylubiquinone-9 3-methyltransferase (glyoxalase superfamily)
MGEAMQKITPFLWYSKEAEEAAAFYACLSPRIVVSRRCRIAQRPARPVKVVELRSLSASPSSP